MPRLLQLCLCAAICALSGAGAAHAEIPPMPAGIYKLDPRHTSIVFKIDHLGFSRFTGRFDRAEGSFTYDPTLPTRSHLEVTIYPGSIDTNDGELDDTLTGENWFDALHYPRAVFRATDIEPTGDATAKITGDFTLHGVTHKMILNAVLVGAGKIPVIGKQVMGFSATGSFDRSEYGISNLEPMIGDRIDLQIETEFEKADE